jgi:hypothetical protein
MASNIGSRVSFCSETPVTASSLVSHYQSTNLMSSSKALCHKQALRFSLPSSDFLAKYKIENSDDGTDVGVSRNEDELPFLCTAFDRIALNSYLLHLEYIKNLHQKFKINKMYKNYRVYMQMLIKETLFHGTP